MCSRDAARLMSANTSPGKVRSQYEKLSEVFYKRTDTSPGAIFDKYNLTLTPDEIEECYLNSVNE